MKIPAQSNPAIIAHGMSAAMIFIIRAPVLGVCACGRLSSKVGMFDMRQIHTLIATGKQAAKAR